MSAGTHWLVCALRLGASRSRDEILYYFHRELGWQLVTLLPGVPVGFVIKDGRLTHPDGPLPEEAVVGHVEQAWLDGDRLLATFRLAPQAERIRRGLLAMERAGRLRQLGGVSVNMFGPMFESRGPVADRYILVLLSIKGVYSLDLVARPRSEGACVLRSLPPDWTCGGRSAGAVKAVMA